MEKDTIEGLTNKERNTFLKLCKMKGITESDYIAWLIRKILTLAKNDRTAYLKRPLNND
jgi:hypothetical protein